MGTTYVVKHQRVHAVDYTDSIDALLVEVNMALSTYIPESSISEFNKTGVVTFETDRDGVETTRAGKHFMTNYRRSFSIWNESEKAFDPTVGPLVNAWGFGWEGKKPVAPDSSVIDSLLLLVGMDKVSAERIDKVREIRAAVPGVKLDFSAIAKGYGVDVVADYLESVGLHDYFVEIGGEIRVKGLSPRGDKWVVGINTPDQEASVTDIFERLAIGNGAMATSGNYRNYYEIDGRKVWHTINPSTGYPEENNLLSASIVGPRCTTADALATACMVKGFPACKDFIGGIEGFGGYFIYMDDKGARQVSFTPEFNKYFVENGTESK